MEHQTTDSGAASGDLSPQPSRQSPEAAAGGWSSSDSSPGEFDKVYYKIGDLGHVAPVHAGEGGLSPEEGDCRYMAPELFLMDVDRRLLQKADIFSLGLSLFEAASLQQLPKNSFDSGLYSELRRGELPHLPRYSRRLNSLLQSMVRPQPGDRPAAAKLLKQVSIMNKKSEIQLCKELRASQKRLEELQNLLQSSQ